MKIIFLIGVGRSGTSLLQSMLASNDAISALPESHFIRTYLKNQKQLLMYNKQGFNGFLDTLHNDEYFKRLQIKKEKLIEVYDKYHEKKEFDILDFYFSILKYICKRDKTIFILEKDPKLIEIIKNISTFFPEAKLIHIVRDPREVVLSKTKASWSANRPYWLHAIIGNAQLYIGMRELKKHYPNNTININYENLLKEPKENLTKLCGFIGIPYQDSMLNFGESAKKLVSKSELSWKKETFGPLLTENTEKWKKEFGSLQAFVIESFSKQYFANNIYKRKHTNKLITYIGQFPAWLLSLIIKLKR